MGLHNMKENINMNTLTTSEREVSAQSIIPTSHDVALLRFFCQGIWVPKLVFSNTEEKDNTLNDDKAFTVARSRNKRKMKSELNF